MIQDWDIDLKKLSYFVGVVECRNFTLAAQRLYVSQPMLSKVVRSIEESLGTQLIERSRRSFHLTEAGEEFYQQSKMLLEQYRALMLGFSEEREEREVSGTVSISISASIMNLFFPKLLVDINKLYPKVQLNVFEVGSNTGVENIMDGKADLAVVMLPVESKDLELYPLVEDRCVLVGHKNHPLMQKSCVDFRELVDETFISFNNQFVLHDMFMHNCKTAGFSPNISYQSSQDSFIMEMVALEQGLAVLPRPVVQASVFQDVHYTDLNPQMHWNVALAAPRSGYSTRATSMVKEAIRDYFSTLKI